MERAVFAGSNNKGISTEKLKQAMPLMWDEQKKDVRHGITGCPFGGWNYLAAFFYYRIFKVARPIRAKRMAIIQKRMVIRLSGIPFFS